MFSLIWSSASKHQFVHIISKTVCKAFWTPSKQMLPDPSAVLIFLAGAHLSAAHLGDKPEKSHLQLTRKANH